MPTPAEEEAERKRLRALAEAEEKAKLDGNAKTQQVSDKTRAVLDTTLREGMAKEQNAQHNTPQRPDDLAKARLPKVGGD